jgi:hypothetical protein
MYMFETASYVAGPGVTCECTVVWKSWSLPVHKFDDRWNFANSIFDLSKYHLYIEIVKIFRFHPPKKEPATLK